MRSGAVLSSGEKAIVEGNHRRQGKKLSSRGTAVVREKSCRRGEQLSSGRGATYPNLLDDAYCHITRPDPRGHLNSLWLRIRPRGSVYTQFFTPAPSVKSLPRPGWIHLLSLHLSGVPGRAHPWTSSPTEDAVGIGPGGSICQPGPGQVGLP